MQCRWKANADTKPYKINNNNDPLLHVQATGKTNKQTQRYPRYTCTTGIYCRLKAWVNKIPKSSRYAYMPLIYAQVLLFTMLWLTCHQNHKNLCSVFHYHDTTERLHFTYWNVVSFPFESGCVGNTGSSRIYRCWSKCIFIPQLLSYMIIKLYLKVSWYTVHSILPYVHVR